MDLLPALFLFAVMLLLPCLCAMANHFYRDDPYGDCVEPRFARKTLVGMPRHAELPRWEPRSASADRL